LEDGEYLAHFVELPNVSAFGESPEEALEELAAAWEGVKESYRKRGESIPIAPARKEYSGQFNMRIDRRLHRALAIEAVQAGVTLHAIVSQKLARTTVRKGRTMKSNDPPGGIASLQEGAVQHKDHQAMAYLLFLAGG
jgi:predicted HicB family RNase H-like nuclease